MSAPANRQEAEKAAQTAQKGEKTVCEPSRTAINGAI